MHDCFKFEDILTSLSPGKNISINPLIISTHQVVTIVFAFAKLLKYR